MRKYSEASSVLSALASNGLTVRQTLLWNSSSRFVDLTSCLLFWKPLTVHRLVDHVQILQNDSNCNAPFTPRNKLRWCKRGITRLALYWLEHGWPIVESVTTKSCFTTRLSPTVTWAFKFLRTTVLSLRDFSDVPVISIPGNIHLQCKQSALGYPIGG